MKKRTLADVSPTEFENLTYDLLQVAGMKSLVWRTPGADGGRDIEGTFSNLDFSGYHSDQTWYVECKLYSASVDWPTVWKKIAYADGKGADYLLLATNSNPSPSCETEIANWNRKKHCVRVRVWRGYEFDHLLNTYPLIAAKYGFLTEIALADQSLLPQVLELMKIAQAIYVSHQFGGNIDSGLEANAALSELISSRMAQFRRYGRMLPSEPRDAPPDYEWLEWSGPVSSWDDIGLRAFLALLRHVTSTRTIKIESTGRLATVYINQPRCPLTPSVQKILQNLAVWADIEIDSIGHSKIAISSKMR